MKFSKFASRFTDDSGIVQLMDDLGSAMSGNSDVLMLGGGNPSHIPGVQQYFRDSLHRLIDNPSLFCHAVGNYELPQGNQDFINAIVNMMNEQYQWGISSENVALTIGSQSAFFFLFNMLAGEDSRGNHNQILLPLTPEYIGYSDVGLSDNMFYSYRPLIEKLDDRFFKYHVDFDNLKVRDNTAAICVSRPTNPTGNVLSDEEVFKLMSLAETNNIPLIVDNAYGEPFPNIIFTETKPVWNKNIIYCMSLSKVGMPGTRTGIVIADKAVVELIRNMNAVINLSTANFGAMIAKDLISSGEILRLSQLLIKPYYQKKVEHAVELIRKEFAGIDYYIHKPEGAMFLWLWFPGLPITSNELYERLKENGVLVISGSHFFPGLEDDWSHKHQCIRITYSMEESVVEKGIKKIAQELKALV
ncbi:MAG: valine--pyruvate transaminase [Proteobacteria bacterium]|nr:valine--pyruvate transaminase [Pseudomonadota bacterium]NOG60781.1 valine--pyruvate transaminase [Pseudomonadota bacterium]